MRMLEFVMRDIYCVNLRPIIFKHLNVNDAILSLIHQRNIETPIDIL